MNRRIFLSTLTALIGIVLAKFRGPVAPKTGGHLAVYSSGTFKPDINGGTLKFRSNGKTLAVVRMGRLYTPDRSGNLMLDTCPHCFSQAIPGYELICCCKPS